jgi:hypothetical protein
MILSLDKIKRRYGNKMVEAILGWIIVLTISFNVAHSPSPLSVNFWSREGAGGIYRFSQYRSGEHEKILAQVIDKLIPQDQKTRMVFHSKIAHDKLSSRYFYNPFPKQWEQADYILLDHTRFPMVLDHIDEKVYWQNVHQIEESGVFQEIFNKDGIVLYRRLTLSDQHP